MQICGDGLEIEDRADGERVVSWGEDDVGEHGLPDGEGADGDVES